MRTLFWAVALICLLVLMAPTLRRAAHCSVGARGLETWAMCMDLSLTAPRKSANLRP